MKEFNIPEEMKLIDLLLANCSHLKRYLFDNNRLSDTPENLILNSRCFSTGEQVLIKVSLDLWDYSGNTFIKDLLLLDFNNFENVLNAILLKRGES